MRLSAYETYCMYLSLKFHFSDGTYDYFKYKGKVRTTLDSFEKRKDKYSFQKLCRLYSPEEMENFLVANFAFGDVGWVGNLLTSESDEVYKAFLKRRESLTYMFRNELSNALATLKDAKSLFSIVDNQLPLIITLYMQRSISLETLIILSDFVPFFAKVDAIGEDFVWPAIRLKCNKLKPFITYDKVKIKEVLKELLS